MDQYHNASWLDLLESSNSSDDSKVSLQPPEIIIENFDASDEKQDVLEIEFNDSENEKKFDKLVTEKKIKSPFKRRLSNEKMGENNQEGSVQIDKKTKLANEESPSKRFRKDSSESSSTGSSYMVREVETDKGILERRQKQIDYGKNTIGYDNYINQVAKTQRTREHPKTPPKHLKYSRRAWEGLIKSWRIKLHTYDSESKSEEWPALE